MIVKELIEELQKQPQDYKVRLDIPYELENIVVEADESEKEVTIIAI